MKDTEEMTLTLELDQRLKLAVDRLGEVRETLEELDQLADSLGPLLGVNPPRRRARAAPQQHPGAAPSPAKEARTAPSSAASASAPAAPEDEVPEWRKRFPALSAQHPKRK